MLLKEHADNDRDDDVTVGIMQLIVFSSFEKKHVLLLIFCVFFYEKLAVNWLIYLPC